MLRDGAGAGYVSAVSNERTLGDIVGDAYWSSTTWSRW